MLRTNLTTAVWRPRLKYPDICFHFIPRLLCLLYFDFLGKGLPASPFYSLDKQILAVFNCLDYTEFILVLLWGKLLAYRNTLESILRTNLYWAIRACPW